MQIILTDVSYDADQNIIHVATTVDGSPHLFLVPVAAVASRRLLYGLGGATPWRDAFVAIMREHFHRLNGTVPTSGTRADQCAGMVTAGVDLVISAAIRTKTGAVLDAVRDDLMTEYDFRLPRPDPPDPPGDVTPDNSAGPEGRA